MELSRRDALIALGGGVAAVGAGASLGGDGNAADESPPSGVVSTLSAAAEVLYPDAVEGIETFVETYVSGRYGDDGHRDGIESAVAELDAAARDWHGGAFADLPPETRDGLLRELGTPTADPAPDGDLSSRLRHHVVNELLYALYTSPTGGRLAGIENPIGHPGGVESYQRHSMTDE